MMGLKRLAVYLLAGSMALSCIYPYEGELDSIEGTLVIEGDIILGDFSSISVSRALAIDGTFDKGRHVRSKVWAEDDEGTVYPGDENGRLDLRGASDDRQYRLHVADLESSRTYVSQWRDPQKAPVIESIDFRVEETDNQTLHRPMGEARLTMRAQEGAGRYFRWDYEQEWQYHAAYNIGMDYDFDLEDYVFVDENPLYWCWTSSRSSEAQIAIAIGDENNRIQDHVFLRFHTGEGDMFQKRYAVHVIARGISEECYQYLHTLEMNSNSTGDLFAPTPSELRGNVLCEQNPDEMVLGFIEVSRISEMRVFLSRETKAYLDLGEGPDEKLAILTDPEDIRSHYADGWRPTHKVETENGNGIGWAPYDWCDCRLMGGTNVKPSYWED